MNIRDFGAIGDGVADDTPAFTAAIAALAVHGDTLLCPRGTYKVTSPLDFSACIGFQLIGEGASGGGAGMGSQIVGTFAGPLIRYVSNFGSGAKIAGFFLNQRSTDTAACVLHVENVIASSIEECVVKSVGGFAILAKQNTFTFSIRRCQVLGVHSVNPATIGIYSGGHCQIDVCDIVGFAEGVRAAGPTVNIHGCRLEVNMIGLNLGVRYDGASFTLGRSEISGNSFEANDVGINVASASNCAISGIGMQGSVNAPSGQSRIGLQIASAPSCTFSAMAISGSFSDAAIRVKGGGCTLSDVAAANVFPGGKKWDVQCGLGSVRVQNCNYPLRPDDVVTNPARHGTFQYLSQVDYLRPSVEGKNLRGKAVPIATGASTKAIVFTGTGHAAGNAALVTATATTGGTLAPATYYYLATAVTAHGECAGFGEKAAVLVNPNNAVSLAFYGMPVDGFKRRIYRGRASGVYDGYFEHGLNSNAAFVDTGQAFDGYKSPPSSGLDETAMIEPDTDYAVVVMPSWLTAARVTGKATTGFTIDFGTPTPDENQTVDWVMVR